MAQRLMGAKREEAQLVSLHEDAHTTLALAEGATLGSYTFRKYKTGNGKETELRKLGVVASEVKNLARQTEAAIHSISHQAE